MDLNEFIEEKEGSTGLEMKFYSNRSPKKGYSWEKGPTLIPEEKISRTEKSEVLIIGGGISGLSTGARVQEKGCQTTIIDKNKKMFALAGQIAAVNSRVMAEKGISIDKKQLAADWMKVSGSRIQEDLLWLFINRSAEGFHWMLDLAGDDNLEVGVYEAYKGLMFTEYPGTHHIFKKKGSTKYENFGGGMLACEIVQKAFLDFGGKLDRDTAALYLEKNAEGRVTGCVAVHGDEYIRYEGEKAVIIATGDCCEDDEMLEAFCPTGTRLTKRFTRHGNKGDGQKMLYWAGAALDNPEWAATVHTLAYSHFQGFWLHVNRLGKRFMNEDTWMQAKSMRCMMQPGGDYCFTIMDAKYADEMAERWDDLGGQGMTPLAVVGDAHGKELVEKNVEFQLSKKNAFKADTIEELAQLIDVPADELKKTIARYNEIVKSGDDTDFGKRKELLTSIEQGPFYALKWGPTLLDVFGGAQVTTNLEVMDADAKIIPGLYAVGNTAGGMYHVDYPLLLNGNSYGRALAYAMQLGDVLGK
ncbi:MAG: FAD-binding protein [Oscillospiraceae bacterium]|nr:FAD-binding protein [Oscillospiraceae bacterium]